MTWADRLKPLISFVSPNGNRFNALWIENERSFAKKLGIFELPDLAGAVVQDLDIGATRYPISFYFDGPNNDTESERFFETCKEKGEWSISHPTKGSLVLQLMSVKENIAPVTNGNITRFETEWIEPLDESSILTTAQLSQEVSAGVVAMDSSSFDQFVEITKQDKVIETSVIEKETRSIVTLFNDNLSTVFNSSGEISSQINSIQRGIESTISEDVIDTESLASQVSTMIQLPVLTSRDANSRTSAYGSFIDSIIETGIPDNADQEGINSMAVKELALVSSIGALSTIATTSDLTIRSQSIGLIESNFAQFENITNYLDSAQEFYDA